MQRRALIGAAITALVGAGALHVYLDRFETEALGGAPVDVLMAARDLAPGEQLSRQSLGVRPMPVRFLDERHVRASDLDRLVGARIGVALSVGDALAWTDLDVVHEGTTLASVVRDGMRAYVLGSKSASFDGLLRPGDRVDVLFSERTERDGARTDTLLQSVLVLSVGRSLGAAGSAAKSESSGAISLSVESKQAQLLFHAEQRGQLRIVLRNPHDLVLARGLLETTDADLGNAASVVDEVRHAR